MNDEQREARLNDYIDGLLDPDAVRAVEEELAHDPEYRLQEQALRAVLGEARQLPKGVAPERDLWPGIEARLSSCPETLPGRRAGVSAGAKYFLLAASLAAVFLAGMLVARMYQFDLGGPGGKVAVGSASSPELEAVEAEYAEARSVLVQALNDSRDQLSPETVAVVDENMAIIANAIEDIKGALQKDPGNPELIRSLVATYDQQVDLLQQVTQLPAQM